MPHLKYSHPTSANMFTSLTGQKNLTGTTSSQVPDNQEHINSVYLTTLPSATTLHGVYMTVLLVLVAVTITMTTLVVYMCLMMRRAKSGRVPQTTTGTTHTNNMAASDFCEPISLRYVTTGTENGRWVCVCVPMLAENTSLFFVYVAHENR